MTEQKRTTAERIETILRRDLDVDVIVSRGGDPHCNEAGIVGVNVAAQNIAAEIDALTRERDALRAEVERLRPAAEAWEAGHGETKLAAWETAFQLQAEHVETWRDRDESYWLARFMEEVGELAGALVGNHIGPVEWELAQLAAIALNWLDMRARAAKERKP